VSRPIARYRPSRRYAIYTLLASLAAIPAAWVSSQWGVGWLVAAVLLGMTAAFTLVLTLRPALEIHGTHLRIGKRVVFWNEIQRLDRISIMDREPWISPLLLRVSLFKDEEILLLHPGEEESCISLLRHIYRYSRGAMLDGVSYSQFWGEEQPVVEAPLALPRPRLLLPEDEEEVERLFQRLKVAGRLDGSDEV